jgi:hypothetical protein
MFQWILAAVCLGVVGLHADNQVVRLTPPKLSTETIAKEVPCVRPMREGTFKISTEDFGEKFVVHCYGHGGCGWTTFMGSVERAIELFQRKYSSPEMTPPIRVVGSGCMGLCSAIELVRRGYKVEGITAKELYDIPSWNAAGYFAIVSVKISPEEEAAINRINLFTFNAYRDIEQGKHPYLSSKAVRYLPVYCSEETHAGVEELEQEGKIPAREVVDIDFGNGIVHRNFKKFMTYFFDVTTLMQEMHNEVHRLEIPVEQGTIENWSDVSETVVFNCTGLGGRELGADNRMIPVRGHLFLLNETAGKDHMDYMIYTKVEQDGKEEYVYLFPRTSFISSTNPEGTDCFGVVGGTFIPNADKLSPKELAELDAKEFKRMLDRNNLFFHGKSS